MKAKTSFWLILLAILICLAGAFFFVKALGEKKAPPRETHERIRIPSQDELSSTGSRWESTRAKKWEFVPVGTGGSQAVFPLAFVLTNVLDQSASYMTDDEGQVEFQSLPNQYFQIEILSDEWTVKKDWLDLKTTKKIEIQPRK